MRRAIVLVTASLVATAAHAQSITKYVVSGQPLKLGFHGAFNPDCSPIGRTTIRLIRAPEHGRVSVRQTNDFVYFRPENVRSACNRRRVAGSAVYYVSQRGFIGTDYVEVETIYGSGHLRQSSYTINVR